MASPLKAPHKDNETEDESDVPSLVHLCLSQAGRLPIVRCSLADVPISIIHRLFRAVVETKSLNDDTAPLFRDTECWYARFAPHYSFHELSHEILRTIASLRSVRLLDVWNCVLSADVVEAIGRYTSLSTLLMTRTKSVEGGERQGTDDGLKATPTTYISTINSLTRLTNLTVGYIETIDVSQLTNLELLQELHIVGCLSLQNPYKLTSFSHLNTLQYSDSWVNKTFHGPERLVDWQMTLKVILRLNQLSCLILTKVNIKDDFIKDMTDMHCLRYLDVSFSGLSFGGLCLMLANTTKLKQCVCVGVKLPSEESVGDMFGGVSAGDVLVLSNKSSIEELVDLLYVHRRAAKTVESLIEVISKECHSRGCNLYQPTAAAVQENHVPVQNYRYLLKTMMHNTGMTRVCTNALRLLRPPDDPTDEFLEKLGSKELFDTIIHIMASTKSPDVIDMCVQVLHPLFQSTNVVLRFLKCRSYVSPIITAMDYFGLSNMMLGLNICVIIFLLGKPFDEPMMDEYIKQGAVRILVNMLDKLGVMNGTVAKKVCLALSVLANTSQQAKRFLEDGGLKAFSDLFNSPESLACYMSSRGIGFLAREEGMVKPICEAGLIPKLIRELRATMSPSQSDFACWALKALLEYKVARVYARRHPDFLDALMHLMVSGSQYCKDRCSEILLELSREEDSFVAIGRKMIPRIIEAINENEGSNDMIQRLLLNLANLVKGCPKNQDMLFELAGQNIYDLALEDSSPHLQDQCLLTLWAMCSNNKRIQAEFRRKRGLELLTATMAKFSQQRFVRNVSLVAGNENEQYAGEVSVHVSQRVLDVLCNFLGSAINKVAFIRGHNRDDFTIELLRDDARLVKSLYECRLSSKEVGDLRGVPLLVSLVDDGDKDVRMFAIYALTLLAENDTTQAFVVRCGLYRHLFRIWMTDHSPNGTLKEKEKDKDKDKEGGDEDLDLSEADSVDDKMKLRAVKMKRTDHEVGNVAYVLRHVLREDPNFWHPMDSVGLDDLLDTVISVCRSTRSLYAKRHSLLTFSTILLTSATLRQQLLVRHEVVEAIIDMVFQSVENYDSLSSSCSDLFSKGVKADRPMFTHILNDILVKILQAKLHDCCGSKDLTLVRKIFGFVGRLVSESPTASVLAESSLYSMCVEGFQQRPALSCLYLDGASELAKHGEFHKVMTEMKNLKAVLNIIHIACKELSYPTAAVVMYHSSLKEETVPGIAAARLIEKLIEKSPDCISECTELGLLDIVMSSFPAPTDTVEFERPASDIAAKRTYALSPTLIALWDALSSVVSMVMAKSGSFVTEVNECDLIKRCCSELQELQTSLNDWKVRDVVYREVVAAHGLQLLTGLLVNADLSSEFFKDAGVCSHLLNVVTKFAFMPMVSFPLCRRVDYLVFSRHSRKCVNSVCYSKQGRCLISSLASGHLRQVQDIKHLVAVCSEFGDQLRCAVASTGVLVRFAAEAVVASYNHQQQELAITLGEALLQYAETSQDDLWDELRDAWMKVYVISSDDQSNNSSTLETCRVPSNVVDHLRTLDAQQADDLQYSGLNLLMMLLTPREFDSLSIAEQDAIGEKVNEKEKKKPESDWNAELSDIEQKAPWPWKLRSIVFQVLAQLLKKPKDKQKLNCSKNEAETTTKQVADCEEKGKTKNRLHSLQGTDREVQSGDMQSDVQPDINYSPRQDNSPSRLDSDSGMTTGQEEDDINDEVVSNSHLPVHIELSSASTAGVLSIDAKLGRIKESRESPSTTVSLDFASRERSAGSDSNSTGILGSLASKDEPLDMSQSLQLFKGVTVDYFKGLFAPLEGGTIVPDLKMLYAVSVAENICNQSSRADNLMRDILIDANWLESAREVTKYYDQHFELLELEPERLMKRANMKDKEASARAEKESDQGNDERPSSDGVASCESEDGALTQTTGATFDLIVDDDPNQMGLAARHSSHTVGTGLARVGWFVMGLADPATVGIQLIEKQSNTEASQQPVEEKHKVEQSRTIEEDVDQTLDFQQVHLHRRILKNCLDSLVELAHISNLRSHFWASALPDQLQALATSLINCTHPRRIEYDSKAEDLAFESLNDGELSIQSPKSVRHVLLTNISSVFWDLSAGGYKAGRELHQQDILPRLLDLIDYGEEYVQKAGAATLVNTSINSLKFGAQCRSHYGFLDRVLVAWKRSVGSDALNKKIAWTLNRIGWDYYPYCTYIALHGGLRTVLELAFMNEVIEDEMLADILDTTHMMLWIPHSSCHLSLQTYNLPVSIECADSEFDKVDAPENFTAFSERSLRYLERLQLKTVLRLLELVDEPLHVSARQSLLHILCLMGIRERCVAEVFSKHFSCYPIHFTVADVIHTGYLKLVPHLMGIPNGHAEFSRARFIENHLSPFRLSLTTETPIGSRVIRVLIVLTNHCAWMAEELVQIGCLEVMMKHLDMLSVDNIADYAQIIAMVVVQCEPSLAVFNKNVKLEFLRKLIDDEDVEKRCSAVKLLSAVSGKIPEALKIMRDVGVDRMFEVIGNNEDLRHKYLACNAVLSVTDYGDYNLTDLVAPRAKLLYDAGMRARDNYTELFEGVMDVLQVLLHTLSGEEKNRVGDLFPLEDLTRLFVNTHIWTYYVFLSLLFSELATMGDKYRDPIRQNEAMVAKCADLLRTTTNVYLQLHMTWLLSSLAFDQSWAASLIYGERGFQFVLDCLFHVKDMDHYAVVLYSTAHIAANDPTSQCSKDLVDACGVEVICDTLMNNPNLYLRLSAAFSLRRLWECCSLTRPKISTFFDENTEFVQKLKLSTYRLHRQLIAALDE